MIHLGSHQIVSHQLYQQWLQLFGGECRHIYTDPDYQVQQQAQQKPHEDHYLKFHEHYQLNRLLSDYFPENFSGLPGLEQMCGYGATQSPPAYQIFDPEEEVKQAQQQLSLKGQPKLPEEGTAGSQANQEREIRPQSFFSFTILPVKLKGYRLLTSVKPAQLYICKDAVPKPDPLLQKFAGLQLQQEAESEFDPEVIMLGTGSMNPSKVRNTSCILLRMHSFDLMMDCGEGTFQQLAERYPAEELERLLVRLHAIVISHSHSDHHLGLLTLVRTRRRILEKSKSGKGVPDLFLVVPATMLPWLLVYQEYMQDLGVRPVIQQHLAGADQNAGYSAADLMQDFVDQKYALSVPQCEALILQLAKNFQEWRAFYEARQMRVFSVPVIHAPQSFGIIVECKNSETSSRKRIAFSGDTRPCDAFAQSSLDCDLMIHECTFDPSMEKNAKENDHSTSLEAIRCAMKANARLLMLTHFSQRYKIGDKIFLHQVTEDADTKQFISQKVIMAVDHMSARLSQAHRLVQVSRSIESLLLVDK